MGDVATSSRRQPKCLSSLGTSSSRGIKLLVTEKPDLTFGWRQRWDTFWHFFDMSESCGGCRCSVALIHHTGRTKGKSMTGQVQIESNSASARQKGRGSIMEVVKRALIYSLQLLPGGPGSTHLGWHVQCIKSSTKYVESSFSLVAEVWETATAWTVNILVRTHELGGKTFVTHVGFFFLSNLFVKIHCLIFIVTSPKEVCLRMFALSDVDKGLGARSACLLMTYLVLMHTAPVTPKSVSSKYCVTKDGKRLSPGECSSVS